MKERRPLARGRGSQLRLPDQPTSHGRTPINGKFTPAQKDIYEIVLRAQDEGIKVAVKGATLCEINAKTVEVIKDGLFKLGLITETKGQQYSIWYNPQLVALDGIDVHDSRRAERSSGRWYGFHHRAGNLHPPRSASITLQDSGKSGVHSESSIDGG
jgi:Xaa-Pro aminopeptidase